MKGLKTKLSLPSVSLLSGVAFLICLIMLVVALVMQHYLKLEPCPLCLLQRVFFALLAVLFLLGALYVPRRWFRRVYYFIVMIVAFLGDLLALRQVFLQMQVAKGNLIPECGLDLRLMLDRFNLGEIFSLLMHGSQECGKVQWTFLTLSIPQWSALFFAFLALIALLQMIREKPF